MPKETTSEIKPLTSLRAVAAGLVFFYHFIYLRHQTPAQNLLDAILQNGFIGVTIFFVLSGFVLTLRYTGEIEASSFQWGTYIRRRVARIYPVYFFILAGVALMNVPINITNVTLTQGFFTGYVQTGDIATWSLTVEECFYLMLPFVLAVIIRFKRLRYGLVVLLAWTLAMLALGFALVAWSNASGVVDQAGFMADRTFLLYRTLFGYVFDFCVGTFTALLYRRRGAFGVRLSIVLTLAGIVGIVGCQWMMSVYPGELSVRALMYGVAVCAGALMFGLTCERTPLARALSWSPLVYMGRISYACYLVQLTQLVWFMSDWPVGLFYVGTNVVSAALYQFIEEPARRLILKRKAAPAKRDRPVRYVPVRS